MVVHSIADLMHLSFVWEQQKKSSYQRKQKKKCENANISIRKSEQKDILQFLPHWRGSAEQKEEENKKTLHVKNTETNFFFNEKYLNCAVQTPQLQKSRPLFSVSRSQVWGPEPDIETL